MRASEFLVEYRTPKPVLTTGTANYNGIVIKYDADRGNQTLTIQALSPQGKTLGSVKFFTGPGGYSMPLRTYRDLEAQDLQVNEKYRGQGIAQTMYDFVKSQGYKIYRSDDQTDAGAAFWDKNRGDQEVWEGLPPMGFNKNPNKHDPIKNPLRTFVEIANMLGITHKQLVGLQRNYPGFPDPFPGIGKQIGRGRNNYYALNQVKQWINNNNITEKIKAWNDNTPAIDENFADKKVKGRSCPGRVKRAGASCKGSVSDLRAKAKKYGGERGRMYHWCANMKSGKKNK